MCKIRTLKVCNQIEMLSIISGRLLSFSAVAGHTSPHA